MSQIGVVSDIHGNLPALEAVLNSLEKSRVERIFCCGDIVGYGPWPGLCVRRIREANPLCVQGNHDAAACARLPFDHFTPSAQLVIKWTTAHISDKETIYLKELPAIHTEDNLVMVHGSLRGPLWEYISDRWVAAENFSLFNRPLALFGHSHIQGGFVSLEGKVDLLRPTKEPLKLAPEAKYLINPGSIGQPRDGDPRAAYAVVDLLNREVHFKRISYDINMIKKRILREGLPRDLGDRLSLGR